MYPVSAPSEHTKAMLGMPNSTMSRQNLVPLSTTAVRKPTPSPLQVTQISTPLHDNFVHASPKEIASPISSRGGGPGSANSYSPRSPHYSPAFLQDSARATPDVVELAIPAQHRSDSNDSVHSDAREIPKSSPLATPRVDNSRQIRNVSAPVPRTEGGPDSPPVSPSEVAGQKTRLGNHRQENRFVPRTSSIDSTMSSVSSTTSYSHLSSGDPLSPNPAEVAQLVAAAGSPEALIRQLLKEKKQSATQNAQLWRLVNKQRTLILGLNTDLERAAQEKEKYRKRLKEQSVYMRPPEELIPRKPSPAESMSSVQSEDDLPIQRHSVLVPAILERSRSDNVLERRLGPSPIEPDRLTATAMRSGVELNISASNSLPSSGSASSRSQVFPDDEDDNEDDSRRNTVIQSPIKMIAPLEIHKKVPPALEMKDNPQTPRLHDIDTAPSPSSFSARRSITAPRKATLQTPTGGPNSPGMEAPSPNSRKGPPAPLNLRQPQIVVAQPPPSQPSKDEQSDSDYDEVVEVDEMPAFARGRKKTREEDDQEREVVMQREIESRSQSKKEKRGKSGSKSKSKSTPTSASGHLSSETSPPASTMPRSPAIRAFSPNDSPASLQVHLSPHASLAGVLSSPASSVGSITERTLTANLPPLSPGLPVSPRPMDRPGNAPPPRQPRDGFVASPPLSPRPGTLSPPSLSPRAPRHPIPLPPQTPSSLGSPSLKPEGEKSTLLPRPRSPALQPAPPLSPRSPRSPRLAPAESAPAPSNGLAPELRVGGVYKGLVSEAYQDLLLPPNALPSILIKVTSSRMKPSRHSTLSLKALEEDSVFTLGISARSDMKQLWRVEKSLLSLPQLDQQLKQVCTFETKLPDRGLFTGHAPAKVDARREALEAYFEAMLDTPMNEKAAIVICQFLSSQVIPAEDQEGSSGTTEAPNLTFGPDGKIVKEGFLTKRGKNFGGWKARFFVLDEPILRYYESPGGALLGTIKLTNAQLGRQNAHNRSEQSPSRGADEDNQFRHAFLILEPKKRDSSSLVRHVLCAESDAERDEWVTALLQYIGQPMPESKPKASAAKGDSGSTTRSILGIKKSGKDGSPTEGPDNDSAHSLQGVSYEETTAGGAPVKVTTARHHNPETPSPVTTAFNSSQTSIQTNPKTISGPKNGVVIHDTGIWGMRPPDSPKIKDKDQKKRSIWGFRDRMAEMSTGQTPEPAARAPPRIDTSRAMFGMPLAEAVKYYTVRGSNVMLPAVVYRCLEYLEGKDAASEEGIFRLSGSNVVVKQLRERFNTEGDLDFLADDSVYYDVHAVASLLKLYLRELPVTVLTRELHLDFLQVLGMSKCRYFVEYDLTVPQSWKIRPKRSLHTISSSTNCHLRIGRLFVPSRLS